MIIAVYNWLQNNRFLNVILVISYYLAVVLPHEKVGTWITENLDEPYGRDTYNLIILILGLITLIGYLWPVWRSIKQVEKGKRQAWFAFIMTFLLVIISFNTLLVVNVEIIHFLQYAILAFFLFPLFNNYRDTLFYSLLFAVIDEGYQYLILAPLRTDYFDFNDLIIDLIGAVLGLLLLWISGVKNAIAVNKWFETSTFIGCLVLTLVFIIGYLTNIIAIYPSNTGIQAPILLIREVQENFWTNFYPDKEFHVVRPLEGLLILSGLFYFYCRCVFGRKPTIKT